MGFTVAVYSYVEWQSAEQQRRRADEQTRRAEGHKLDLLNAMWKLTNAIPWAQLSPSANKTLTDLLEENVQLLNKMTEQKGETPEALRQTSVTWTAIGDIRLESGAVAEAEEAYQHGLDNDKRLVEQDPSNRQWQRDLSVSYNKIGRALHTQNRLSEALENYQKGLDIRKRLIEEGRKDDESRDRQRDLAFSYGKIAEVNIAMKEFPAALAAAEQARVIRQELLDKCQEPCKEDPRMLADVYAKIAWIALLSGASQQGAMQAARRVWDLHQTAVPNETWNEVCWEGLLDGQALAVMRACDVAVERAGGDDPIHEFRDSRGLARALTGNTRGAIEDFEFFIEHTDNAEQKSQRQRGWVRSRQARILLHLKC